jgi:cytochrome c biogenesis factor
MVNPLVIWIWIGGGIFLFGGLIAFWPGRKE